MRIPVAIAIDAAEAARRPPRGTIRIEVAFVVRPPLSPMRTLPLDSTPSRFQPRTLNDQALPFHSLRSMTPLLLIHVAETE